MTRTQTQTQTQTQSQQLSVLIDMFLQYRERFGFTPERLFFEGWFYLKNDDSFILSYEGNIIYPSIEESENNEFADTFVFAINQNGQQSNDEEKHPKANILPTRSFEEHLHIKRHGK